MIKILRKLGIEVNFLNAIDGIHEKFIANIIFNSKRLKAFLLRPGKDKVSCFHCCYSTGASNHRIMQEIMQEKEIKGMKVGGKKK